METFKSFLLAVLATIRGFFKQHHELITLPIALVLWLLSVPVLRTIDPTAAVFDAGIIVMVANPLPPYIPIRRELYRQGCGVLSVWAGGVQVEA